MHAGALSGRRVAFFLPNLRGGGAEQVALTLAREFSRRGLAVDMVLQRAHGELLDLLPPDVRVIDLKAPTLKQTILPFRKYLQAERPAAVQISMWPLTVYGVIAKILAASMTRLVISDHNTLSRAYAEKGSLHRGMMHLSTAFVYPRANARVAVSKGVAEDLSGLSGLHVDDWSVIPNPISVPSAEHIGDIEAELLWGSRGPVRFLAVGSFKPQKNFPLLVRAFADVTRKFDARLMILGEGEERGAIEAAAAAEGVADKVILPGFRADPWPFYRSADRFVLSSNYEGFGNVIVEALGAGLPVISTDCPSGPAEILGHGEFGRLVPCDDRPALARAMIASLRAKVDPAHLKARARLFSPANAADSYLDLMLGAPAKAA